MDVTAHLMLKNEEIWIGHNLMPLVEELDHIIIADTGSEDDTLKIVREVCAGWEDKVTILTYNISDKADLWHVRQDMTDITKTEWVMIIDGDEYWPPSALREIKDVKISDPEVKLVYARLDVVRFDEGPLVAPTSMGNIGNGYGVFRYSEPWSGQCFLRREGLTFSDEYPAEVPNWYLGNDLAHYLQDTDDRILDFHHLMRSRFDEVTPHRMGKRPLMPMGEALALPFNLKKWFNPYAERILPRL